MDFSLSSSLVGSAVSNPDKLALDLQFATDKTLTARKGPTPTFTRASSGTFVGSNGLIQSAGTNVARFDHDPVTLACKGLLIEESRTNLVLRSEAFNTTWSASQLNITGTPEYLNAEVAPDGTLTAELIIGNTSSTTHQFRQDVTLVSGTTYTLSCYFYGTSITSARHASIAAIGTPTGSVDFNARFDALAGTKATPIGFSSSEIQNAGNGWWRCSAVFTAAASGTISFRTGGASSTSIIYTGNNTDGIGVWGAQVEAGSFATSYIPTTTASVIRSADVCSISGSNFSNLWNTSGGTFLFEGFLIPNAVVNLRMLSSGAGRRWLYGNQPGSGTVLETVSEFDGALVQNYFTNVRIAVKFKIAISVEALTCKASFNGSAISTTNHNGNLLNSVTLLGFFENASGFITGVKYYRKNLANTKLQALST